MLVDKCSSENVKLEKKTVGTTAVYSQIVDINDFESCCLVLNATTLAGSSPDKWVKLVCAETSSSSTFASDVVSHTDASDYIKSDTSSSVDALTQTILTSIEVDKKIGLTKKIMLNRQYLRFKLQAGTDASEVIVAIVRANPRKYPVNQ